MSSPSLKATYSNAVLARRFTMLIEVSELPFADIFALINKVRIAPVSPGTAMPDLRVGEGDARDITAFLYTRAK